jgi:YVTN family beta-propeller protein
MAAVAALLVQGPAAGAYEVGVISGFHDPRPIAASPVASEVFVGEVTQNPSDAFFYLGAVQSTSCGSPLPWSVPLTVGATASPSNLVFERTGGRIWVLTAEDISSVDPATCLSSGAAIDVPDANDPLRGLDVNPAGTRLYAANPSTSTSNPDTVSVINLVDRTLIRNALLGTGTDPGGLAVSPDGSKVYVTARTDDTVWSLNTADNTSFTLVASGSHVDDPNSVEFSPDGSLAYVANASNVPAGIPALTVIDTATGAVVSNVDTSPGFSAIDVAVSPDGRFVYVLNSGSQSISVVSAATRTLVASIPVSVVGPFPWAIAISPTGTRAWVSGAASDKVAEVRLGPGAPTGLSAAASPGGSSASIAFTAGTDNGQAITGYEYSLDGGAWTAAGASSTPVSVSGLAAGSSYSVRLRAINGQAPGDPSAPLAFTVPAAPSPSPSPVPPARVTVASVSTRITRSAVEIRSRVSVSSAGSLTQVASRRLGRSTRTLCRASRRVSAAGLTTLTCRIGRSGRAELRRRSLKLTLRTSLAPRAGSAVSSSRSLTIARRR